MKSTTTRALFLLAMVLAIFFAMWSLAGRESEGPGLVPPETEGGPAAGTGSPLVTPNNEPSDPAISIDSSGNRSSNPTVDQHELRLEVVLAASEDPASQAEVLLWDRDVLRNPPPLRADAFDLHPLVDHWDRRNATTHTTNDRGRVELEQSDRRRYIVARSGSLFGIGIIPPGKYGPERLHLYSDFPIEVEVTGNHGMPVAFADITLRGRRSDGIPFDSTGSTTDARGIATISHAGWAFQQDWFREDRRFVALYQPLPHPVEVEIWPDRIPPPKITLQVPEYASIEIAILDGNREPAGPQCSAIIAEATDIPPARTNGITGPLDYFQRPRDGILRFPCAGVGREYVVIVWDGFSLEGKVAAEIPPLQPGQRWSGEYVLAEDHSEAVTLHLVGPDRTPLARQEFSLTTSPSEDDFFSWPDPVETDEFGIVTMEAVIPDEPFTVRVSSQPALGGTPLVGERTYAGPFSPAVVDLGELQLTPLPLVAAGRVLRADGQPSVGAWVWAHDSMPLSNGIPVSDWPKPDLCRSTTDIHGRFWLYGDTTLEQVHIFVMSDDGSFAPQAIAVGTSHLELALFAPGSISGFVNLPANTAASSVQLTIARSIHGAPSSLWSEQRFWTHLTTNGQFSFERAPSGSYDLTLVIEGAWRSYCKELIVTPGKVTKDPRLNPVSLPPKLVTIAIRNEAGWDVSEGHFLTNPPPVGENVFFFANGVLRLEESDRPSDIAIEADGYITEFLSNPESGHVVTLREAPYVSFRLPPDLTDLAKATFAEITLHSPSWPSWYGAEQHPVLLFNEDGVASGYIPAEGQIHGRLFAIGEHREPSEGAYMDWPEPESPRIQVTPGPEMRLQVVPDKPFQTIEIDVLRQDLERAIKEALDEAK